MLRAIAPNPDSRYQTTATFAADLRAVAAALEARAGTPEEAEQTVTPAAGGSRVLMAVVLLVALAAIAWLVMR